MKSRSAQAKKIAGQMNRLSTENPQLKEALRVFDISYDQYQKAVQSTPHFYTDTSTVPKREVSDK